MSEEKASFTKQLKDKKLIAEFVDGYASGWFYAVGEAFRECLDIKWEKRKVDGKDVWAWLQGRCYNFKEGYILYDTPKAYLEWSEALQQFSLMCEIQSATPSKIAKNRKGIIEGMVYFSLKRPNLLRTGLDVIGEHRTTQSQFVAYLKSGNLLS